MQHKQMVNYRNEQKWAPEEPGKEFTSMLILYNKNYRQKSGWDQVPDNLKELPPELARADKILEDERFFEPFLKNFSTFIGRPSVPVEVYIYKNDVPEASLPAWI